MSSSLKKQCIFDVSSIYLCRDLFESSSKVLAVQAQLNQNFPFILSFSLLLLYILLFTLIKLLFSKHINKYNASGLKISKIYYILSKQKNYHMQKVQKKIKEILRLKDFNFENKILQIKETKAIF